MLRLYDALLEVILDVEPVNIDMFRPVVIDRIMSNTDSRFIVAADVNWLHVGDL